MSMALKSEVSIPVTLATGAVVIAIYSHYLPAMAESKTVQPGSPGDMILGDSGRTALITSAAVAGAISLIAKDELIFALGGGLAVALYWMHAYSRAVDPGTGKLPQPHGNRYQVEAA